jgi:aspartyl-tRNA(Asn)/glutamyl-tRNA(Gln) amidotransferase subunit C
MSLTIEQVKHIANLARLELTEGELVRYREQLSSILAHFEQLEAIDTEAIPPTASVSAGESTLRVDQSRPGLSLDDLLYNAPDTDARQFRVPPIFE